MSKKHYSKNKNQQRKEKCTEKRIIKSKATVVLGAVFGDEGKGKVSDILGLEGDIAVKATGGNNAGHTMVVDSKKIILRLIPSGILSEKISVIANGVTVNPRVLKGEIETLIKLGIDVGKLLKISDMVTIIFPYHVARDLAEEKQREKKIGTTLNGIGPSFADETARYAIKLADLYKPDFYNILKSEVQRNNLILQALGSDECYDEQAIEDMYDEYMDYADMMKPYVTDTVTYLHEALEAGKKVVIEGAQAVLLDVRFGTRPFVTSSSPCVGGILSGTGLSCRDIGEVCGVIKAYTSRVGEGPFVTEEKSDVTDYIRDIGHEYGSVTGRPRRIGWLDLVALKYAIRLNGITQIALNHLDTIGKLESFKVCDFYEVDGLKTSNFTPDVDFLERAKPCYKEFQGNFGDISNCKKFEDLPENAQKFIKFIEQYTGCIVTMIGVGAERENMIKR